MKKTILLSVMLVYTSVLVFGQTNNSQSAPTKNAPAATTTKPSNGNVWTKPKSQKTASSTSKPTPESMTAPTGHPSGGGAKPATGNRWKSGGAHGPVAKTSVQAGSSSSSPQSMTAPGGHSASGGAKPATGNRWKGGNARGPATKSNLTPVPETKTTTTDKK